MYVIKPVNLVETPCEVHHPACQCREAYFRKIEAELISEKRYIQFLEDKLVEVCDNDKLTGAL